MPRLRPGSLFALTFVVLIGFAMMLMVGAGLLPARAAPLGQTAGPITIVSNPPPAALPDQSSDVSLLQPTLLDPDSFWRLPTFDDSSWRDSYSAVRRPDWGNPLAGSNPPTKADFIWGGSPGAGPDANNRFEIPANPVPQFLFLRKNFCIPLNTNINSITTSPLRLEVAAAPGSVSVYYNGVTLATGLVRSEDEKQSDIYRKELNLDPTLVSNVNRVGRNTLAMRIRDDVGDQNAGVAYDLTFNYNIDSNAIIINHNPASPTGVNTPVTFSQTNNGLSDDGPYTFAWDLGNGSSSTLPTPSVTYTTPGTYTITLTITDRFGCSSTLLTTSHVVLEPVPVHFSSATYTVGEDQGAAVITVILDAPSSLPVQVNYTTSDGTAITGRDYTATGGVLTIPAGSTSQTFTIPLIADGLAEPDETVTLTLFNPANAEIIAPNPATLIISDIAPTPTPITPPESGGDYQDDDDDDETPVAPPPVAPTATPSPGPVPTEVADFPLTLPETGRLEQSAKLNSAYSILPPSALNNILLVGVGTLLGSIVGYYIIGRSKRDD